MPLFYLGFRGIRIYYFAINTVKQMKIDIKELKYSNKFIYGILVAAAVAVALFYGTAAGFMFFGLFHLLMWLNMCVNNLCNAILFRGSPGEFVSADGAYRLLCILVASVCLAVAL